MRKSSKDRGLLNRLIVIVHCEVVAIVKKLPTSFFRGRSGFGCELIVRHGLFCFVYLMFRKGWSFVLYWNCRSV